MHVSVLLKESIDGLALKEGDTYVDATLGAGGHSKEVAKRLEGKVKIIGFDLDSHELEKAGVAIKEAGAEFFPVRANFRYIKEECEKLGILKVNRVLFDLGISSMDLESSGRGFSFKKDEPLLMTLSDTLTDEDLTAEIVVNSYSEEDLANVIFEYGEEKFSRSIAKAISKERKRGRIKTTFELVDIIRSAVPNFYNKGRLHPATKTFQALRIHVNDELGALKDGLEGAWEILEKGGRISVITFHSLEDRIVKNYFKDLPESLKITKKPIVPEREEIIINPRSRSAKLRIIEKT